jgi:trk system potassium uptake protein TrkA
MRAVIIGGGRTGSYVARDMAVAGHDVTVLDKDPKALSLLEHEKGIRLQAADGCDPEKLEEAATGNADIVMALTGQDEDNLVVSWLSKYVFGVTKVIARVNNPKNSWLYSEEWGVDAPVSAAKIISVLIEEEARLGNIVTLAKLKEGLVSLVEIEINGGSPAAGMRLAEVGLPSGVKLVAVMRDHQMLEPEIELRLTEGDSVVALTSGEDEKALAECFSPPVS